MAMVAVQLTDGGGGSASSTNFAVYENLLMETKKRCEDDAAKIEEYINTIYTKIGDMNAHWSGGSYDEFSSTCEQYKDSLNQLVNIINAFGVLIGNVDGPRGELETAIINALNS